MVIRIATLILLLLIGNVPGAQSQNDGFRLYLPIILRELPKPAESEPNDSRQQANGPLELGVPYYGVISHSKDEYDIYFFQVSQPGAIRITLNNPPVNQMQLQLHSTTTIWPLRFDHEPPFQIDHTITTAGTYYISLYFPAGSQSSAIYELKVYKP